jgi:hypothetical protein
VSPLVLGYPTTRTPRGSSTSPGHVGQARRTGRELELLVGGLPSVGPLPRSGLPRWGSRPRGGLAFVRGPRPRSGSSAVSVATSPSSTTAPAGSPATTAAGGSLTGSELATVVTATAELLRATAATATAAIFSLAVSRGTSVSSTGSLRR